MGDFIINNKTVASLMISNKEVIRIANGQTILWEKTSPQPVTDYLCFTANEANCSVGMTHNGTNQTTTQPVMYYSTDQTNWTLWDYSTITLANAGDKVYFYGNNPNGFSTSSSNYSKFTTSGSVACSGNIMTLITRDGSETTLPSDYCFVNLFKGTSITTAPELSATGLTFDCYYYMFSGCGNLTTAPALPATTLAPFCYYYMFYNCTGLTTAPALPATTLAQYCYANMFYGCINMTTAPALPATILVDDCYYYMFQNCKSLSTAPELPATTLATDCYKYMFKGCSQLNYIKVGATTWYTSAANNWVNGVAATGTFVKPVDLVIGTGTGEIPLNATNGIPTGWTVVDLSPDQNMLRFTAQQANSSVGFTPASGLTITMYKSTDGTNFTSWDGTAVTLANSGDTLWVYGNNQTLATNHISFTNFVMTGQISAAGDATYLLQNGGLSALTGNYIMCGLFENCTSLTTAPSLPSTTLTRQCYGYMFYGCSGLTTAPSLPATTLANGCYYSMFENCTSLTTAPSLPATTLADSCYYTMFASCSSLVNAPALPATTLADSCYFGMFAACNSLVNAPALPATTLANSCYFSMFHYCTSLTTAPDLMAQTLDINCYCQMFDGCTNLNSVTCMATNISAGSCTLNWLRDVAVTGTFYKSTVPNWSTGPSGIPSGWTTQDVYTCADDYVIMGYVSDGECACTEDGDNMGHASLGDCMCNEFNECMDCSTDWETLGYSSEEECNCQMYDDCIDCTDCNNYAECGYESYEDCDCQVYGNCGEEQADCNDWESLGYSSYEDCNCQEYSVDCAE